MYGETNDKVVTNAGFFLIAFFPTFVLVISLIMWRLDKRKDRRKAAEKARTPAPTPAAAGSHAGQLRAPRRGGADHDRPARAPQRGRRPDGGRAARGLRGLLRRRRRAGAGAHGRGRAAFCAGADLKAIDTLDADPPGGPLGFTRLGSPKPTIAAVSGCCLAGGFELALWCDLRVVTEAAVLGFAERRWGVPLIDGGTQRLARIVGEGRALDLVLTGRMVDAAEAHAMGIVTEVVPAGGHLERALEMAEGLAAFPQDTMLSDRRALLEAWGCRSSGLAREAQLGREVLGTAIQGAGRFAGGDGRGGSGTGVSPRPRNFRGRPGIREQMTDVRGRSRCWRCLGRGRWRRRRRPASTRSTPARRRGAVGQPLLGADRSGELDRRRPGLPGPAPTSASTSPGWAHRRRRPGLVQFRSPAGTSIADFRLTERIIFRNPT